MKLKTLALAGVLASCTASVHAATSFVVTYADSLPTGQTGFSQIAGNALASSSTADNLTIGDFTPGQGVGTNQNGNLYSRTTVAGSNFFTGQGAIATNAQGWTSANTTTSDRHYYEFSLSAAPGYTMNVTGLSFDWNALTNHDFSGIAVGGAINFLAGIWYSVDGGQTFLQLGSDSTAATTRGTTTAEGFSGVQNVSETGSITAESITFRISFAVNGATDDTASLKGGLIQGFNNIQITGSTYAIPEPSSAALGLFGLLGFALRRKR